MELKKRLVTADDLGFYKKGDASAGVEKPALKLIGAVDISTSKRDSNEACAGLLIMEWPTCAVLHSATAFVRIEQPYVSGFLAFRESKPLAALFDELSAALGSGH